MSTLEAENRNLKAEIASMRVSHAAALREARTQLVALTARRTSADSAHAAATPAGTANAAMLFASSGTAASSTQNVIMRARALSVGPPARRPSGGCEEPSPASKSSIYAAQYRFLADSEASAAEMHSPQKAAQQLTRAAKEGEVTSTGAAAVTSEAGPPASSAAKRWSKSADVVVAFVARAASMRRESARRGAAESDEEEEEEGRFVDAPAQPPAPMATTRARPSMRASFTGPPPPLLSASVATTRRSSLVVEPPPTLASRRNSLVAQPREPRANTPSPPPAASEAPRIAVPDPPATPPHAPRRPSLDEMLGSDPSMPASAPSMPASAPSMPGSTPSMPGSTPSMPGSGPSSLSSPPPRTPPRSVGVGAPALLASQMAANMARGPESGGTPFKWRDLKKWLNLPEEFVPPASDGTASEPPTPGGVEVQQTPPPPLESPPLGHQVGNLWAGVLNNISKLVTPEGKDGEEDDSVWAA